jgi:hypothetical protein
MNSCRVCCWTWEADVYSLTFAQRLWWNSCERECCLTVGRTDGRRWNRRRGLHVKLQKCSFHNDAWLHKCAHHWDDHRTAMGTLPHPIYSPNHSSSDLAPADFRLFGSSKGSLQTRMTNWRTLCVSGWRGRRTTLPGGNACSFQRLKKAVAQGGDYIPSSNVIVKLEIFTRITSYQLCLACVFSTCCNI